MDWGAAMNNPGAGAAAGNAQIDLMSWYDCSFGVDRSVPCCCHLRCISPLLSLTLALSANSSVSLIFSAPTGTWIFLLFRVST